MNKLTKLTAGAALIGALAIGTVACSNDDHSESTQSSKVEKSKKSTKKAVKQNETKLKRAKIDLSQKDALDKFDAKYPNKQIKSIDLKQENGTYVYEIDGFDKTNEYTATIDADNGKVLQSHSEKLDVDDLHQKALDLNSVISRDEATKIAEKHADGVSKEWNLELDEDDGKAYWDVEVSDGTKSTEVKINATNKDVVKTDRDHDNDDD
ncbi:PepSY domain-containing protein [Lactobacillus helveticus]|uniref:PepSY domain-containing protein n=1 Tax=Lactobacillus TaxID=1578 RepID=UPI0019E76693|nr:MULTISPECIES: PepSY domain-containing protein [Lactobacillus]MCO0807383.1 PepSY domain-containing protein [Lactobacillus helveticus]MDH5817696.1 PepSY domain-containing protein [Lactobacillus helveticus]MDN5584249.1 PepSY domain-containing protein [Lactobacillus sp.]MDN5954849.1 PepSY domain-containing protein [Lactobacillus sp.]MDN5988622.1 PepSY domain-containing protein [Lactobacillus sp.]